MPVVWNVKQTSLFEYLAFPLEGGPPRPLDGAPSPLEATGVLPRPLVGGWPPRLEPRPLSLVIPRPPLPAGCIVGAPLPLIGAGEATPRPLKKKNKAKCKAF